MKTLVTGVAGFLGSHIAEALLEEGHEVLGFDDLSGGDAENIPEGVNAYIPVQCQEMVPRDFEGVDLVYHCAALAHEGLSVFSPSRITDSIFGASVAVFSAAANVKRIVYCSSMARYGAQEVPFHEYLEPMPEDPYGIAKVASEQVLEVLSDVHGFEFCIAVPHNIVGPRQRYTDPFRNVASIMANLMLQGRRPYIYGNGQQVRCFSDIRDVVPCFLKLGDPDWSELVRYETINIGPDDEFVTINDLCELLMEIIGFKGEPIYLPGRPLEVKYATCSSAKSRRLLDYRTRHTLKETLEHLVEWIDLIGPKPFSYHLPIEIPSEKCPKTWSERLM